MSASTLSSAISSSSPPSSTFLPSSSLPSPSLSSSFLTSTTLPSSFLTSTTLPSSSLPSTNIDHGLCSPANELKLLNRKFQDSCYAHAKELNRIAQLVDPSIEQICLGQAHRAAGIFVYTRDEKLMLGIAAPKNNPTERKDVKNLGEVEKVKEVKEIKKNLSGGEVKEVKEIKEKNLGGGEVKEKKNLSGDDNIIGSCINYQFLGGKAQGDESPLETALREFQEESGIVMPEHKLKEIYSFPQYSHYVSKGKYTLFFLDLDKMVDNKYKTIEQATAAGKIIMVKFRDLYSSNSSLSSSASGLQNKLHPFAKLILEEDAVKNFICH